MKAYTNETVLNQIKWQDLIVGDLVMVRNNESIPADIVLLVSSETSGSAYIATSSLDGEKAPKQVMAVAEYQKLYNEV